MPPDCSQSRASPRPQASEIALQPVGEALEALHAPAAGAGGIVQGAGGIVQVEPLTTARSLHGPFDYKLEATSAMEVVVGSLLIVPFGRREILGVATALRSDSAVGERRLRSPVRLLPVSLPGELVQLAQWLAEEYCSTFARALRLMLPPLTRGQLSGKARKTRPRRPQSTAVGIRRARPPALTAPQGAVLKDLLARLHDGERRPCLLHGVTGSGKTEIYLRLAAEILERGQGAIVLVPEIALTPQMITRFTERFGDTVAVLHSRLRESERREEWRRLRAAEARICVGPRSAVFAPVRDLGLIVIDEEHDASYKHEGDPRYDARVVAMRRAERAKALLIAGSATPRLESVRGMSALKLSQRVDGRPLPSVEVLDMRDCGSGLHPASAEALARVRNDGGKAIVLLNRRGWSNFLSCRACGTVWSCPNCDVALVMHKALARLSCHHCGYEQRIPDACACGCTTLARHGAGTERLHDDLEKTLEHSSFPIFRLDADTAGASPGDLLARFEQADAGVLVGTQMVAKGHDFSDVSLGIVLDADATLRFPDFRAEERTFALIAQLAGRVGRGGRGRVYVQTIAPEARSILYAARHDSEGFIAGEMQRRQALGYPPFRSLIRVVLSAAKASVAHAAACEVRDRLAGLREAHVLGPASLFRLRGRERSALVLKASDRTAAIAAVRVAVDEVAARRGNGAVSFAVDVDPQ